MLAREERGGRMWVLAAEEQDVHIKAVCFFTARRAWYYYLA